MSRLRQRGVTMIEALVALVVLSLGMLGIATLYLTTLRAARSAITRMQAVNLLTRVMGIGSSLSHLMAQV